MPRTVLPTIAVVGPYPVLPVAALSLDFAFSAADNVNANQFPFTGREVLLVQNTAGAPGTFTLTSIADSQGRTGDITTYQVGAGLFSIIDLGRLGDGWRQADGNIYLTASAATMKFAVLRLSSSAGR
jgi:hypothetical protein